MRRIGLIKKNFLTVEVIKEAIQYLTKSKYTRSWTKHQKLAWKNLLNRDCITEIYNDLFYQKWIPSKFRIFERLEYKKVRIIYASEPKDLIIDYILSKCLN